MSCHAFVIRVNDSTSHGGYRPSQVDDMVAEMKKTFPHDLVINVREDSNDPYGPWVIHFENAKPTKQTIRVDFATHFSVPQFKGFVLNVQPYPTPHSDESVDCDVIRMNAPSDTHDSSQCGLVKMHAITRLVDPAIFLPEAEECVDQKVPAPCSQTSLVELYRYLMSEKTPSRRLSIIGDVLDRQEDVMARIQDPLIWREWINSHPSSDVFYQMIRKLDPHVAHSIKMKVITPDILHGEYDLALLQNDRHYIESVGCSSYVRLFDPMTDVYVSVQCSLDRLVILLAPRTVEFVFHTKPDTNGWCRHVYEIVDPLLS